MGRMVYDEKLLPLSNEINLNTSKWNEGIYYYSLVENNNVITTKKLVLIRH